MAKKVLGIEIGSKTIKIALIKNGKKPVLLESRQEATPKNAFQDGNLNDIEAVAWAIQGVITQNRQFDGVPVAICINSYQSVTRALKLPALPEAELPAAVEYELGQSFPGVGKTHVISFKEYTRTRDEVTGIASFCPVKVLEGYKRLANAFSARTEYLDVSPNCFAKAWYHFAQGGQSDACILHTDIGALSSQFNIIHGKNVILSRAINSGDSTLDQMIMEKFSITAQEAEDAHQGDFRELQMADGDMSTLLRIGYSNIEEQLHQTIEFYNYNRTDLPISKICLSGGGSLIPGLAEYLSGALQLPVEAVRASANLNIDQPAFNRLMPAIGAAIRED